MVNIGEIKILHAVTLFWQVIIEFWFDLYRGNLKVFGFLTFQFFKTAMSCLDLVAFISWLNLTLTIFSQSCVYRLHVYFTYAVTQWASIYVGTIYMMAFFMIYLQQRWIEFLANGPGSLASLDIEYLMNWFLLWIVITRNELQFIRVCNSHIRPFSIGRKMGVVELQRLTIVTYSFGPVVKLTLITFWWQ